MAFPSTIDAPGTTMQGTTLFTGDDHANEHRTVAGAVINIETFLGTNLGTNVFQSYQAGWAPLAFKGGTLQAQITRGTINLAGQGTNFGTQQGGVYGTATWQGGTINNPIVGTPAVTGGTYNTGVFGTPAIQAGTATLGFSLKDNGSITQTGTADHITLTPGASKLVRSSVLQQNGTTNNYVNNAVIQDGWTWMAGANGTITTFTQAITFGVNFTSAPVVTVAQLGAKVGSDPTSITDGTQTGASLAAYLVQVTGLGTTGFTMNVLFLNPPNNGARPLFTWTAIGPV